MYQLNSVSASHETLLFPLHIKVALSNPTIDFKETVKQ